MSDRMLLGILAMPLEMAMGNELSRVQFHDRAQQAVARIKSDGATIEQLVAALEHIRHGRVSQAAGDRLSDTEMARIADQALTEVGLGAPISPLAREILKP